MSYNLREKIDHIGYCKNQIVATNNLPSIQEVLAVLFYNLRRVSPNLHESARLTIEECLIIWTKAKIPTQEIKKCIRKLEKEHERWAKIRKNHKRDSKTQKQNEREYLQSINKLFDIAHANALDSMKNELDKQFLIQQRNMPRNETSSTSENVENNEPLAMEVESGSSDVKEDEILDDVDIEEVDDTSTMKDKHDSFKPAPKEVLNAIIGPESESPQSQSTPPIKKRATELVITRKLAIALDKCRISKRNAMHTLMAAAEAFGVDTSNLVLNNTSISEARKILRKERYEAIKKLAPFLFSDLPSTIHWDGKLLPGFLRKETVDRLAIIITSGKTEQLLGVPKISSSTGVNQAQAVFESLNDWSLVSNVEALCCDSTSSNTGRSNGACVILEGLIGKDLLYLICRHHIYELVPKCIFELKFGKSTGPEVPLFKSFQGFWKSIDQNNYEPGINDEFVKKSLADSIESILSFCLNYLKTDIVRSDYKEFLELVVIFLGGTLPKGNTFHPPGAIHHARFMAKAIYCLKMFIFRKQYLLDEKIRLKCRDVCIFITRVYVQAWFCTPIAAQAPSQDLNFLKSLYRYKSIDESVSTCAIKKFQNHLWYLVPELSALAFFDSNISAEEKSKMCEALESIDSAFTYQKRILVTEKNVNEIINSSISDYICHDTYKFFQRFKIETSFLKKDPSKWANDKSYIHGLNVVKNLKVVNDTAEREIKLVTEFNNLLTKDYNQSQYLLPVIKDYQSVFPDANKATLMQLYA